MPHLLARIIANAEVHPTANAKDIKSTIDMALRILFCPQI